MSALNLFSPITIGSVALSNRIVMAPMTRCRADVNHNLTELMVEYYAQRASAGLIITEGTSPSRNGIGYARTPGLYTPEQIAGWKKITEAVHKKGGKIFIQIMHVGRVAHPLNKDADAETVAPSAIAAAGVMYTDQEGLLPNTMPRALDTWEIANVIAEYKRCSLDAIAAGFDGVELHAANGYLPMQFLSSNSNQRTDQYGGSVENRIRFVVETLEAMIDAIGADKVGIRISPAGNFNDMKDANPAETYTVLLKALNPMNLAYVHTIRSPSLDVPQLVRDHYKGLSMINGGFDLAAGNKAIAEGLADLVSFGSLYISNPNLVERFKEGKELTAPNSETFYTADAVGYTDYL
jgi:N-ethylmaleimide reductase